MAPSVTPFQYGQNIGLDVLKIPGTNGPDVLESGIPHFGISGYETLGNSGSANPVFLAGQPVPVQPQHHLDQGRAQRAVRIGHHRAST